MVGAAAASTSGTAAAASTSTSKRARSASRPPSVTERKGRANTTGGTNAAAGAGGRGRAATAAAAATVTATDDRLWLFCVDGKLPGRVLVYVLSSGEVVTACGCKARLPLQAKCACSPFPLCLHAPRANVPAAGAHTCTHTTARLGHEACKQAHTGCGTQGGVGGPACLRAAPCMADLSVWLPHVTGPYCTPFFHFSPIQGAAAWPSAALGLMHLHCAD